MWSFLRNRSAAAASPLLASTARRAPGGRTTIGQLAQQPCIQQRTLHVQCARCAAAATSSSSQQPPSNSSDSSNSFLRPIASADSQPQLQRAPSADARPDTLLRDRPSAAPSSELTLAQQQAREMDRATKAARAARMRARKSGTDWRERMDSRRSREARIPLPLAPPIYFPSPFASLPVIPSPRETLESALIRIDKVPKSPGFSKEISRIRGQLAKYNYTARRQLEVAQEEMAEKLARRIEAFPKLRKQIRPRAEEAEQEQTQTPAHDPFAPQLHPYDHSLISHSLSPSAHRGGALYTSLLNHCSNLVQKLRGAAALGLKGLNHSKNMSDSRRAHTEAILRMKSLWTTGDPSGIQSVDGGSGQKSGMQLVESLRALSKQLRHIPTIDFDRNLLDVKRNVASYLSVLPPALLFLPEESLTFETLRPYLPPSPAYTFSLVGAPNVGKSSLLRTLSRAKVEVRNFAFTTTAIQVGHLERTEQSSPSMRRAEALTTGAISSAAAAARAAKDAAGSVYPQPTYTPAVPLTRVQLVDTPGLLFRPDVLRKSVEHLTLSLCAHINPLILAFVIDETGTSGAGVRTQRFLLRELRQRFSFHNPPHPLASDTDPRNHAAHDALYANVAADAELQSLTRRLQVIPWLLLRSKSDVTKRNRIADEVLARATKGAEKEVRIVEAELCEHNRAVLEEQDEQEEESEEDAESSSKDLALLPSSAPTPNPRVDRPAWKLEMIRQHMRRYLARDDGSGSFDTMGEEGLDLDEEGEGRAANIKRLASSASGSATDGPSSSESAFSSTPSSLPLPSLSVSAESGRGLPELEAHIWFEVDRRESLRLERAYKEMKKRILWMTGRGGSAAGNHAAQIANRGEEQQPKQEQLQS